MLRLKKKVRIYIQDGPTYEGVLAGRTRHTWIVWDPSVVTTDDKQPLQKVSGHVEIPRERVLYWIVIG